MIIRGDSLLCPDWSTVMMSTGSDALAERRHQGAPAVHVTTALKAKTHVQHFSFRLAGAAQVYSGSPVHWRGRVDSQSLGGHGEARWAAVIPLKS